MKTNLLKHFVLLVLLLAISSCKEDSTEDASKLAPEETASSQVTTSDISGRKNVRGRFVIELDDQTLSFTEFDQVESGVNFEKDLAVISLRPTEDDNSIIQIRIGASQIYDQESFTLQINENSPEKTFDLFFKGGGTPLKLLKFKTGEVKVYNLSATEFNADIQGVLLDGAGTNRTERKADIQIKLSYDRLDSDAR
jgi:hypothetical protein